MSTARIFPMLIRREFWEHRALWMTPLVVAALFILVCFVPGAIHLDGVQATPRAGSNNVFIGIQLLFVGLLEALTAIVVFFYLSDCLYADRKDRSILFWKSLPVSDSATVLSKLLVAILVVPLGIYVLAVITNLLAFGILTALFRSHPVFGPFIQWNTGAWLRLNLVLLVNTLVLALWFAPVAAYQLLVSAWAKGSVFVWTILPPLIVIFGERLIFGTWNVASLLVVRLGGGLLSSFGRSAGRVAENSASATFGTDGLFQRIDAFALLATPGMWIGVAVAVLLVFAAIRIRRYRDDT
jgi:ABC-2 type transport system permease protein